MLPFTLLVGAEKGTLVDKADNVQEMDRAGQGTRMAGVLENELRFLEKTRRQLYERPDSTWWPYADRLGLRSLGNVDRGDLRRDDLIVMPNDKGSFLSSRAGRRASLPRDLQRQVSRSGEPLEDTYQIVQLRADALRGKGALEIRDILTSKGLEIVEYVPNNAYLVRVPAGRTDRLRDSEIQYVTPYGTADRIHSTVGARAMLNPNRAVSDQFDLVAKLMPGQDPAPVEERIAELGGTIVARREGDRAQISFTLRNTRLYELARSSPEIYAIHEAPEYETLNLTTSATLEIGRFLDPREFGDFILPYRRAGIDGGGLVTGSSGADVDFSVAGSAGAPLAYNSNHANFQVPPQYLGVADNGLTLDSPAFSHDNKNPCLNTGACTGVAGDTGLSHRKIEVYTRGSHVDFGALRDATSTGDFKTCDAIRTGGFSHGSLVAGAAAGNPSGGRLGLGRNYDDIDSLDLFVAFFNDSREADLELDGQARGARVIFEDVANTPVSAPPACAVNFLGDVDAGDDPSQRLRDMVFRRDLAFGNSTPHARGARVTLFAFGNPTNFDDNLTNGQGNYALGADDIDDFLWRNRRVLHVQAVGNDGADPTTGAPRDPLADPNFGPQSIQINDLATLKNGLTVGSTVVDNFRASTDPGETMGNFTSKGPATANSLRIAPLVLAPGVDTDGGFGSRTGRFSDPYYISLATIVSFDDENDSDAGNEVENILIENIAGTSVSAGKIAGAAVQVRDYFSQGYYPTGSADATHRVQDVSGQLVKALLINSTDFPSVSPIANCPGRFCIERGYGKVELANTLPLSTYRRERRPADLTNVNPIPNIAQKLLVVDEYFDGGARGSGSDGSTTGIGVVQVGESVSFDVYRRDGQDQMRISLAWADKMGEMLQNNLDLEVISGDYEIVGGGTGICADPPPDPSFCSFCRYDAIDNDPTYFDASGLDEYVFVWRGNQFQQFGNEFSLQADCDDDPNSAGYGAPTSDFNASPQNEFDSTNNTEQVVLHYFGHPSFFGASRSGGDHGPYRVRVHFRSGGSAAAVPFTPIIDRGVDGTLTSTPLGGSDDTIETTADGRQYISAGPDGIAQTTAAAGDVQLIDVGQFGQPFALAIAGPLADGSSTDVASTISLDKQVYDCSEKTINMRVADLSRIPTNTRQAETSTNVALNTRIDVHDEGGNLVDTEKFFSNEFSVDGGSSFYRVSRANHYNSASRTLQFISDRPGSPDPIPLNGIVEVQDGWTISAVYDDQSPLYPGAAAAEDAVSTSRVECTPFLGDVLINVGAGGQGEPLRRTNIVGGCDEGRVLNGRGDLNLDAGEFVIYQVGFANQNRAEISNLVATLTCTHPTNPAVCDPNGPMIQIIEPNAELGVIPPGREGIAAWTIFVDQGVKTLPTNERFVDFVVSFSSRGTDLAMNQTFTFREPVQADTEILYYNTDFPFGGTQAADRNRDGLITTVRPGSTARNRELQTYAPLCNTGNPNLASLCGGTSGSGTASDDQIPWHFDRNNGGFTAFRTADSKPGSTPPTLGWFWGTAGGCGWQTQNDGVVLASAGPRGIWHAGHSLGSFGGGATACPVYTIPSDPQTAPSVEFIRDVLTSPILTKVNQGLDARGLPFDIRMEAVGWNETQDFTDVLTNSNLQVDSNIDDGGPVILGTSYTYRLPFGIGGPRNSAANSQLTFGPRRDSDNSLGGGIPIVNGDEVGISTPVAQRNEASFIERALMAFPVADDDPNTRGFQANVSVDPNTGLPNITGVCTGGFCTAGADDLIGMACGSNAACTGPGTRLGHSTSWGPVRNREVDLPAGRFEEFRGSSGNRFQFELGFTTSEGGVGGQDVGWSIDDLYLEWSERHPVDQDPNGPNDCSKVGDPNARPGANPAAAQCGTVSFERLAIHNCTTGIDVIVTDNTPTAAPNCDPNEVSVNVRTANQGGEPLGEEFCLKPLGNGVYRGTIQVSAVADQPGILYVESNAGNNFNITASYKDDTCDQDSDGELSENNFLDIDGDGVDNFGLDGIQGDISQAFFYTDGQGASDDDNCYDANLVTDVWNPPGVPQRDNNGGGTISSEDCLSAVAPGFPPFLPGAMSGFGQCDYDRDGFGDLCDNCPTVSNSNQIDTDLDGVGNACEDEDIDKDAVPNASDNCPTLYNPAQNVDNPGDLNGTVCNQVTDADGDGAIEVNDNCPNYSLALNICGPGTIDTTCPGNVQRPPFSATYNPSQADNDADGIGDKCDSEDFDHDLVVNQLDNCPTVYNPADPTFQIQTDSDQDGLGDDRDGIDTQPGNNAYCDPDSDDDNNSGIPDDLIQLNSELNCNWTTTGITNVSFAQSSVGSLAVSAVALSDDGTSDFFCTSGDPDPNNNPAIPEPCPQENSGSPNNDAFCDTPGGGGGDGVCEPVPDGTADPGEVAGVQLTLVNASTDAQTGGGRALSNLTVGIKATNAAVGCVPRASTFVGNLGSGAEITTPAGALSFIVDPDPNGPGRSTSTKLAEANFRLTAQADQMEGISPAQDFKFTVDVDRIDAVPFAAGTACPVDLLHTPSVNESTVPGMLCETFDINRNGDPAYNFSRLPLSQDPVDVLRANGDLTDDVLGFTIDGGASPFGTDASVCAGDAGFPDCQDAVSEDNDWHLHSDLEGPGAGYDGTPGIGAPDGGKNHTIGGRRSMHMGRHTNASNTLGDSVRFRQVSAFVLDSQGDPNIPGIVIGPSSGLEFWHMISVPDDENFGSGFVSPGTSFGGGQVQMSLLGLDGKFEKWQRLTASFNGYDSLDQGTVSLCSFDPGDDQSPPADETFCDSSNGPLFADMGDIFGSDATCTTDTDNNDPAHADCGAISCVPGAEEVGACDTMIGECTNSRAAGAPCSVNEDCFRAGCTQGSAFSNTGGVWTRSAFDLSPFAGRVARLRWIGMIEGGWSFGESRSAQEPEAPPAYEMNDGDDGWYIDDIRITDLRSAPASIGPDTLIGTGTCVEGEDPGNCGSIAIGIAGESGGVINGGTLLQSVELDGRGTMASGPACDYGVLQFQWSECLDAGCSTSDVIQTFSPDATISVSPAHDTTYKLEARCSSDSACAAEATVIVQKYTGDGSDLDPGVRGAGIMVSHGAGTDAVISWTTGPQPAGVRGYDVYAFDEVGPAGLGGEPAFPSGVFGSAPASRDRCVAFGVVGSMATDAAVPSLGNAHMYQVGHHTAMTGHTSALGIRPPSSSLAGTLVTSTPVCP